ncbi:MAG: hypothetical protein ACTHN5_23250 [Phycisphaerae bacterium]
MRYFKPKFQIATLAPPQTRLLSKIGGLPWGLPAHRWPHHCGHPQKLIAQLCHEPPMLDLGDENAVLHLFMCGECGGINQEDTGLDAFILNRSELHNAVATIDGCDHKPEDYTPLTGEAWITGWIEHDDGIPASRLSEFFDEKKLWELHREFPQIQWFDSAEETKFGGTPRWTGNGPMSFPPSPFEFLLQLGSYLFVDGPPPDPNNVGCQVEIYSSGPSDERINTQPHKELPNAPWYILHERGTSRHYFAYTNFAFDGTAFVFIDRTHSPPIARWFYNR